MRFKTESYKNVLPMQFYLYHGSLSIIDNPIIRPAKHVLDFGSGFYTTTSKFQAISRGKQKLIQENRMFNERDTFFVNAYNLIVPKGSSLKIKIFNTPDIEWLDTITNFRTKGFSLKSDIIIAPVADAFIKEAFDEYLELLSEVEREPNKSKRATQIEILKNKTIANLKVKKDQDQVVFLSDKAIKESLHFARWEEYDKNKELVNFGNFVEKAGSPSKATKNHNTKNSNPQTSSKNKKGGGRFD